MRICIICPVRKGTPDEVFGHVEQLEKEGNRVFFPTRDIDQRMPESEICQLMRAFINLSDEVHVWYSPDSQGVHFDLGLLFADTVGRLFNVPKVKWLNPVENPVGYEAVLKEMSE